MSNAAIRTAAPSGGLTAEHSRLFHLPQGGACSAVPIDGRLSCSPHERGRSHSFGWQRARCKRNFFERAHAGVNGADGSVELASDCRCFNAQCEKLAKLFVLSRRPRTTCWSRSGHQCPLRKLRHPSPSLPPWQPFVNHLTPCSASGMRRNRTAGPAVARQGRRRNARRPSPFLGKIFLAFILCQVREWQKL